MAEGELRPTDVVGAFFVAGIAFMLAGVTAAVVNSLEPWAHGRWLALHLVFVGGISQLVLGASQFFVGALLATGPPARALVRAQLALWNAGALLLAIAVPSSSAALIWLAVALLVAGLGCYGAALAAMRRHSLQRRLGWRWYATGAGFLAIGVIAGGALAEGTAWTHGDLLAAHMALNLGGWFGAAIVGTFHTFYPSLTRTELPRPSLERWTLVLWAGGVAALALGYAWAASWLATAGWFALLGSALALAVNVAGCLTSAPRPLMLPARLLGAAHGFLVAGLAIAAFAALAGGPGEALAGSTRSVVATLLVAGWIAATVLGSLVHLLAVVVRVRDLRRPLPAPRPFADGLLTAAVVAGVTALALARGDVGEVPSALGGAVLVGAYAVLGARVLALAARVVIHVRPAV